MKKRSGRICYFVLFIFFVPMVIILGSIGLNQKRMEEEFREYCRQMDSLIHAREVEEADRLEAEEQKRLEEEARKRMVLVEALPIYASENIRKNREEGPKTNGNKEVVLEYGSIVKIIDDKYPYALVQVSESVSGFIWHDCIGAEAEGAEKKRVVVIDAGYQQQANSEEELIGPGAEKGGERMPAGGEGVSTGISAYELTLDVALMLEEELEKRGYMVVQTRRGPHVDISSAERALLANQIHADILIGLYLNDSKSSNEKEIKVYCAAEDNPFVEAGTREQGNILAQTVVMALADAMETEAGSVIGSNGYAELNWCAVPAIILKMGCLSNGEEDRYLNDMDSRTRIVEGIADGVDDYFNPADISEGIPDQSVPK